jgi:Tannase and feruloyl esterase
VLKPSVDSDIKFEVWLPPESVWNGKYQGVGNGDRPSARRSGPDLNAFNAAGGKLIQYHGWNDAAIPAQSSINYYQSVAAKMDQGGVRSFYRLFMAPGMDHCGGGVGPNAVNGVLAYPPLVLTPLMTLSQLSRIGSKTVCRRTTLSRRAITTMTQRRESRRNYRGAPIR